MNSLFILALLTGVIWTPVITTVDLDSSGYFSDPKAVLLEDDFESYSTADPFPAGSWVNHNGSTALWSIVEDGTKAARQTAAVTNIISNGDVSWTDYQVSARVKPTALGFRQGIVARFTNTSSYYSLYLRSSTTGGTKVIELNKRTAAGNNVLQTVSIPMTAGVYYKLTLEVNGTSIKGYVDNELKVQATDADYPAGKVGFYNTGDSYFDDLLVEDFSSLPQAPANLVATPGSGHIALTWTAVGGATSYNVKRGTADGGPYETIASASAASFTDTTVVNNTQYFYVVSAVNPIGESPNSNQASATSTIAIPGIPSSLISASGDGEARIYWTASTGTVDSYNVKRSLSSSGTYETVGANVTLTEFTDTGLTNGTTYYYRVSAVNSAGGSANSGSVVANPRLGQVVNVSSQAELSAALNTAVAGDEIIVADGSYAGFKVRRKYGTSEKPIVLRSQNPRGAIFNTGQFELERTDHVVVEGFKFSLSTSIKLRGTEFCRLTQNLFELNEAGLTDLEWVSLGSLESNHNRIDHNDFKNKVTTGGFITLIGSNGQVTKFDRIDNNYFFNLGPRAPNDKEAIRIGDSSVSRSSGFTILEYNLFEQCDGDPEIVSLKTHDNIVRYNTFRRSKGALTARQGNRNSMHGNYFLGENVPETGGIRAYGDDHKIYNNYFEGLTASDTLPGSNYSVISLTNGDADGAELPGSDQSKHYRPQRILIANNTLVGNNYNIEIGGSYTLPPRDITIANNIIVGSSGMLINHITAPINPTYAGNIAYPTGDATIGISASETEVRNMDPLLVQHNGTWKLSPDSPAKNNSIGSYPFIIEDIDGQLRDANKDVGADEFGDGSSFRLPLTSATAGLSANTFAVGGRVIDDNGVGIAGVTLTLFGQRSLTAATDTDGHFLFTGLRSDESFSLTPIKAGKSFAPNKIIITGLKSDMFFSVTGTPGGGPTTRTITGRLVTDRPPTPGLVTLVDSFGHLRQTQPNWLGYFRFNDVVIGEVILLDARSKRFQFSPRLVAVTNEMEEIYISTQQ